MDEERTGLHRQQEVLLATVAAEGPLAVAELFRRVRRGDTLASGLPVGPTIRALPGIGWLTAREIMTRCGIADDATPLGALDHERRAELSVELARIRDRERSRDGSG